MSPLSRRRFLHRGSAAAGLVTLGAGWTSAATTAWAEPSAEAFRPKNVHRDIARDARMLWRKLPGSWQDAPFLANGFLGVQVYRGATANQLRFMLSHSEVQDQRPQWEAAVGLSRLPIGYLTLTLAGEITAVDWQLDLWDAELSGTVTTTAGSLRFRALVHNDRGVLLVSLTPNAGEEAAAWGFTAMPSKTTRQIRIPPDYTANPDPRTGSSTGVSFVEQPLHAGGGYTTAWQEKRIGTTRLLAATVAYGFPRKTSTGDAVTAVRHALLLGLDPLVFAHRAWWHRFHTRSLVSVPDKWVQRFYWIQLYKMACATRENAPVTSEWGPWFPEGGGSWTAVWWNLNVQITYPFAGIANHPELDAVTATFRKHHQNLEFSVPPELRDGETYALAHPGDRTLRSGGPKLGAQIPGNATVGRPGTSTKTDQTGNLIWGLHNVWLSYRHSMDRRIQREVLYPLLRKALNFYLHFLKPGADGLLHLPLTRSPEFADAVDATYDLSLIRWAARTLLETTTELRIEDPLAPRWREVLAKLVPYHRGEQGVLVGEGVTLSGSHRHFSHLLWFHPLREISWETGDRDLIRRTFEHWTHDRSAWAGYSYPAAAMMSALMGEPDQAIGHLRHLLDGNVIGVARLTPNTMYVEGNNLALESPLSAAESVLHLLLDSGSGVLKVFPAVPAAWREAAFDSLRAQGAFLVDASRRDGATEWVRVHSEAGEPLVLEHGIPGDLDVRTPLGRRLQWRQVAPGRISVALRRGETAIITRRGHQPDLRPRDVPANAAAPQWGLP
ncbi:glycosyl hydrolase family 95 catalytic domain-containing protein [Crossiella sp. CA198]|uniref:glycosyl hydrolase family 95 catalytic domain-containing protein n=1 Tax=Crossiella sp. CA198 TaxID=3455607 RepID=UPI003F8D5454